MFYTLLSEVLRSKGNWFLFFSSVLLNASKSLIVLQKVEQFNIQTEKFKFTET